MFFKDSDIDRPIYLQFFNSYCQMHNFPTIFNLFFFIIGNPGGYLQWVENSVTVSLSYILLLLKIIQGESEHATLSMETIEDQ